MKYKLFLSIQFCALALAVSSTTHPMDQGDHVDEVTFPPITHMKRSYSDPGPQREDHFVLPDINGLPKTQLVGLIHQWVYYNDYSQLKTFLPFASKSALNSCMLLTSFLDRSEIESIEYDLFFDAYTPLHLACFFGRTKIVDLLLKDKRTNPNIQATLYHETPLHLAVKKKQLETIRILLEKRGKGFKKVNPCLKNYVKHKKHTPYMIADRWCEKLKEMRKRNPCCHKKSLKKQKELMGIIREAVIERQERIKQKRDKKRDRRH